MTNLGPGTLIITNGAGTDNLNVHVVAAGGTVVLAKGNTSGGTQTSVHATGQITIMNGATVQLGGTGGFEMFEGRSSTNLSGGVLDLNGQNQAWGTNSGSGSAGNLYLNGTGISDGGALINSSSMGVRHQQYVLGRRAILPWRRFGFQQFHRRQR